MNTSDFVEKLQKCNSNIFTKFDSAIFSINADQGTIPLYLYGKREDFSEYDKSFLDDKARDFAERPIKYLTYIPRRYIPYVTQYTDKGVAVTPGLRDVLKTLVSCQVISKEKVLKYFNVDFYGENTWDKMSIKQRIVEQHGEQEDKEAELQSILNQSGG